MCFNIRDMPNGLLINEIEREQTVRKYLLKESKIGQNSSIDSIKDRLCMDFVLNSYKSTVMEHLTNLSPKTDDSIPIDEYSRKFIQVCELVLEKTCSSLTSYKRIFNLNSQLNPGVSAIMKSLLKTFDGEENTNITVNSSKSNETLKNLEKTINVDQLLSNSETEANSKPKLYNIKANQALSVCDTRSLRSKSNDCYDGNNLESTKSSSNANIQQIEKTNTKELLVVLERLDSSLVSKMLSNNIHTDLDLDMNEKEHPLKVFEDLCSSSSDEGQTTRKLRNRKIVQTDKKVFINIKYNDIKTNKMISIVIYVNTITNNVCKQKCIVTSNI